MKRILALAQRCATVEMFIAETVRFVKWYLPLPDQKNWTKLTLHEFYMKNHAQNHGGK